MATKGKLAACLCALGINPRMETFSERKLLQKLGYLLKRFGIDFRFGYSWYLHGPYSPDLTRMLFEMVETSPRPERLSDLELTTIEKLKSFLGDDMYSSDNLELLVSIDFLRRKARRVGASDSQVLAVLKKTKPYFTERQIRDSWQKSIELEEKLKIK